MIDWGFFIEGENLAWTTHGLLFGSWILFGILVQILAREKE